MLCWVLERDGTLLCVVQSNDAGQFRLSGIPCGVYSLVPFYKRTHTMYDVVPSSLTINVTHDDYTVTAEQSFQVMGFSLSGQVVDKFGKGVADALISVNGVDKVSTDSNGRYKLDQIQSGVKYSIKATKNHITFSPLRNVQVFPNATSLPDIVVTSYHICGVVNSGEPARTRSVSVAANGKHITT